MVSSDALPNILCFLCVASGFITLLYDFELKTKKTIEWQNFMSYLNFDQIRAENKQVHTGYLKVSNFWEKY